MRKPIEENLQLIKTGMVEKGTEEGVCIFRNQPRKFVDRTELCYSRELGNSDQFKRL